MLPIFEMFCPDGLKSNPQKNMQPKFITIHCTGNYKPTATAYAHAKLQAEGNNGQASSWHYTVDDKEIWQSYPDNRQCYHAGDGVGMGNTKSIGIEICVNNKEKFVIACQQAAKLVQYLMIKHGIPKENIVQHNHWSGKDCPKELRNASFGVTWCEFLLLCQQQTPYEVLSNCGIMKNASYWQSLEGKIPYFYELMENMASYVVKRGEQMDSMTVLELSAAVVTIGAVLGVFVKYALPIIKIGDRVLALERHEKKNVILINENELSNKLLCKAMVALIDNKLTDNHIDGLKVVKAELMDFITKR